jgi:soluble cytochrome b562
MESRKDKYMFLALLACAVVLPAQSHAGEIKQTMHQMRRDLNAALASASMPTFVRYEKAFESDVQKASQLGYGSDPATYRQGMQKLQAGLAVVDMKVRNNDLASAKATLAELNGVKKRYHNLLN